MFIDPIVQEVRSAREKIAAECNYDFDKIMEREKEVYERYKNQFKIVSKEELERLRRRQATSGQG
ncbi:MAG TPA: hypothetical protein VIH42_07275 [Thermoguttaceae bacterium]